MDLIEELGGYGKAKAFLNATYFTIDQLIMMQRSGLRTQHVEKALLEYRRANNIFEVGDLVVMRGTSHYDICEFVEARTVLPMYMLKDENGCKFGINKKCVDHATDEEIAAGHRL